MFAVVHAAARRPALHLRRWWCANLRRARVHPPLPEPRGDRNGGRAHPTSDRERSIKQGKICAGLLIPEPTRLRERGWRGRMAMGAIIQAAAAAAGVVAAVAEVAVGRAVRRAVTGEDAVPGHRPNRACACTATASAAAAAAAQAYPDHSRVRGIKRLAASGLRWADRRYQRCRRRRLARRAHDRCGSTTCRRSRRCRRAACWWCPAHSSSCFVVVRCRCPGVRGPGCGPVPVAAHRHNHLRCPGDDRHARNRRFGRRPRTERCRLAAMEHHRTGCQTESGLAIHNHDAMCEKLTRWYSKSKFPSWAACWAACCSICSWASSASRRFRSSSCLFCCGETGI